MNKAVKTAMSVADDLLGMLRYLMRLFEKGVDEVVAFFKKITDDFFDWLEDTFKRGKVDEVLDNVKGKGLYGGKILSKAEIEDWAKLLKKKFGTNLEKVEKFDNSNIIAPLPHESPATARILSCGKIESKISLFYYEQ